MVVQKFLREVKLWRILVCGSRTRAKKELDGMTRGELRARTVTGRWEGECEGLWRVD